MHYNVVSSRALTTDHILYYPTIRHLHSPYSEVTEINNGLRTGFRRL